MKSFYQVVVEYYLKTGMSSKEAKHHARADVEYIRCVLMGEPIPKPSPFEKKE